MPGPSTEAWKIPRIPFIDNYFFIFNPLFVTICPETFSNRCVDTVRDMQEIRPVKFSLLLPIARIDVAGD
jgi:hypothetical protein